MHDILTERQLIKMMRKKYEKKIFETLSEIDVVDSRGNIVIGKDLKVRHKKSQYEYTVDDVVKDPSSGEIKVALKLPDEPRFEPGPEHDDVLIVDKGHGNVLEEEEIYDPESFGEEDEPEIFIVDKEEFEKEYEVK
jgi:hypothetical protein